MCAQHWYGQDGTPMYTVPTKKGGTKNTSVKEARELNLVPSYSTIVGQLDKPGLSIWLENQIIEACMEWPYRQEYDRAEWKKEVKNIAGKLGRQGRERGTMVHDLLERVYKGRHDDREYASLIFPVLEAVDEQIEALDYRDWVAEESFAYAGYGGKVDLHSKNAGSLYWATIDADGYENGGAATQEEAMELADNYETVIQKRQGIVIDFKTKDVDDIKKMKPYPNDVMQHAAYRDGLGIPRALCYTVFVNVRHPGMVTVYKWKEEEVRRGRDMFLCLRDYFYLVNKLERAY